MISFVNYSIAISQKVFGTIIIIIVSGIYQNCRAFPIRIFGSLIQNQSLAFNNVFTVTYPTRLVTTNSNFSGCSCQ